MKRARFVLAVAMAPGLLGATGPTVVNLNGHTVSCDGRGGGSTAIDIRGSEAVVKNGRVRDCEGAIVIRGSGGHQVTKMLADNNSGSATRRCETTSTRRTTTRSRQQ